MKTEKSELAKAVIAVMREVKGIEKSMTVGNGNNAYKGVPDQEVKKVVGEAMAKHGLCILPIDTTAATQLNEWEVEYNGQKQRKQSVFTEVTTKYLLLHESGESQVISGYGHGVDSQDKGAGKATTYALKYALLYTFLVPTGKIDDADSIHSDSIHSQSVNPSKPPVREVPKVVTKPFIEEPIEKIKACKTKAELTALYNSMPTQQQAIEHILEIFKVKSQQFKTK